MATTPPQLGLRRVPASLLVLALAVGACAKSTNPEATDAKNADPPPTLLRVELPPGVQVTLDGEPKGSTPLDPIAVQPGSRAVLLENECQRHEATLEVPAGRTKTLTSADAPTLSYATLHLRSRNLAAEPLSPRVTLGDHLIGETLPAGDIPVPTCKLRLALEHPDLGGYLEDLDLQPGQHLERDIILAPGPDMVRLPGGPFTLGPPARVADEWRECCGRKRHPVEVAPFHLDRTEVTAGQFQACVDAGACKIDPMSMTGTRRAPAKQKDLCNLVRSYDERRQLRHRVPPGRENHPANCIAKWQAEQYCAWVGKRLPTDMEWEYASRSGNEDYDCPSGILEDKALCRVVPYGGPSPRPTTEVCSAPTYDSEHGVCDLTEGVNEWVTPSHSPSRETAGGIECYTGGIWSFGTVCSEPPYQHVEIGFRCARDVTGE
jgi:formylglycine-generating enzyme required for sulfatase activity